MKVHSYARNINLNSKCGKLYVETQRCYFSEKTVIFFLISNVLQPFLAGIRVEILLQYFYLDS